MSWPTDTITTTYLDAGTDDPSLARAELKTVADKVKDIIAGRATASGVCDLDSSTLVPAARLSGAAITTALGYTPWHPGNDGAGSTLDADTVDTYHAASFLLKAGGAMTGDLDMNSQDIDNCKTITFTAEYDAGNSGSSCTIDWNNGANQKLTLNAATPAIAMTAPLGPGRFLLKMVQDATGSRNPTWDTSSPGKVYWVGGTEPTWSTAANAIDFVVFYFDGTDYFAQAALGFG